MIIYPLTLKKCQRNDGKHLRENHANFDHTQGYSKNLLEKQKVYSNHFDILDAD